MHHVRLPLALVALALAAGSLGCAGDATGEDDADLRIKPKTDESPKLAFAWPAGTCWSQCDRQLVDGFVSIDGKRIDYDIDSTSALFVPRTQLLAPGPHEIELESYASNGFRTKFTVELAKGQSRVLGFAGLRTTCTPPAGEPVTSFGLGRDAFDPTLGCPVLRGHDAATAKVLSDPVRAVGVAPGTYEFVYPGEEETVASATLAEGEVRVLELPAKADPLPTFGVDVRFADVAELPTASPAWVGPTDGAVCGSLKEFDRPAESDHAAFQAYRRESCAYELSTAGRSVVLAQDAANDVTLHRLDVDSMEVAREDGSTYVAPTTYTLRFGGNAVGSIYDGGTGIWVLPGTYEIVVTYQSEDLGSRTEVIEATVP